MRQIYRVAVMVVGLLAGNAPGSRAATTIGCPTLSSSGGVSTSPTFFVIATLGQPVAGTASGATLSLSAGFVPCLSDTSAIVDVARAPLPLLSRLARISPNPFATRCSIVFDVARPALTTVRLFDVMGRLVHTLIDGRLEPGSYTVEWDGGGLQGVRVGAGVYCCQFHSGTTSDTRRITLVK